MKSLMRILAPALLGGALLAVPAFGETLVLKNFSLIDGKGGPAVPGSSMVVTDGRIVWVGASAQAPQADGAVVDLGGKFVMPGLIDTHVHIGTVVDMTQLDSNYTRESVEKDLRNYAFYGVTTVASMGTDKDLIFDLRREQRDGRPTMARVMTAGQGIVYSRGYGGVPGINMQVSTPAQATSAVDAQAAKGADYIKLWLDDELGAMPKMPPEISQAVIDAAHRHGLKALGHIFYLADAKRLAAQGIDGFVHAPRDMPIDAELLAAMKKQGTVQWAATLSREQSLIEFSKPAPEFDDPFFQHAVSPAALAILKSPQRQAAVRASAAYPQLARFAELSRIDVKREMDAGVPVGMGTDSGPPGRFGGYFAHWELALLVQSGMTPAQAIHAATGGAAELLDAKGVGTIVRGNWADLLVLDADPNRNILNTRKIDSVYIAGRKIVR